MKDKKKFDKLKLDYEFSTSFTKQYKLWLEQNGKDLMTKDALLSEYKKKIESLQKKLN